MAQTHGSGTAETDALPFVAPCRRLPPGAAFGWVRRGIADLRRAPRHSLGYGLAIFAISAIVTALAFRFGSYWLLLATLSGFVFIGPLLAIGLYSISAQLERGEEPSLRRCLADEIRHRGTAMVFALVLLVIFLVWARAASMLSVFFPEESAAGWRELAGYLAIGSAIGSIFAAITFAVSAFSLPMIADRRVDAITAAVTSVNAVLRNKRAMLAWIAIIVLAVAIGFATLFVGLAVTLPVIGHATWHAYRETIDASAWPRH